MNILNTERGTYNLSDRKDVYRYFCQNFGMKGDDLSLLEKFLLNQPDKNSVPMDVVMGLINKHKRTCEVIGNFLDRITVEAISNPDLVTAHMGIVEAIHSYKRSLKALEEFDQWQKGRGSC